MAEVRFDVSNVGFLCARSRELSEMKALLARRSFFLLLPENNVHALFSKMKSPLEAVRQGRQ